MRQRDAADLPAICRVHVVYLMHGSTHKKMHEWDVPSFLDFSLVPIFESSRVVILEQRERERD